MADYSLEFVQKHNFQTGWDFSIECEFSKLKEGQQKGLICEGGGWIGISKDSGKCLLIYPNRNVIECNIELL